MANYLQKPMGVFVTVEQSDVNKRHIPIVQGNEIFVDIKKKPGKGISFGGSVNPSVPFFYSHFGAVLSLGITKNSRTYNPMRDSHLLADESLATRYFRIHCSSARYVLFPLALEEWGVGDTYYLALGKDEAEENFPVGFGNSLFSFHRFLRNKTLSIMFSCR